MQILSNRFVEQARQSQNKFANDEDFTKMSIYNYDLHKTTMSFLRIYMFNEDTSVATPAPATHLTLEKWSGISLAGIHFYWLEDLDVDDLHFSHLEHKRIVVVPAFNFQAVHAVYPFLYLEFSQISQYSLLLESDCESEKV